MPNITAKLSESLGDRLRRWRSEHHYSEARAVALIRRRWLAITVRRLHELEAGAEPEPEEWFILDALLPRKAARQKAA